MLVERTLVFAPDHLARDGLCEITTKVEHTVLPPSPDLGVLKFISLGLHTMSKTDNNSALFL